MKKGKYPSRQGKDRIRERKHMKKILVVLTGGTIGSRAQDGIIDVSGSSPYLLLQRYQQQYGGEDCFETMQPFTMLSENMTPETIRRLMKAIDGISCENYQGIIVTHGSDTLSYTAAFAGLLFHHLPIPVVFVASNYPLGMPGSNGLSNFACAVDFIRKKAVRGVFAIYRNAEGENQVFLATRLVEAEPCRDQFRDFSGMPFGRMEGGELVLSKGSGQPLLTEVEGNCRKDFEVPEEFTKNVLLIRPYPGLSYEQITLSQKPAAVLHYLYHSATACTEGEAYNLIPFIRRCKREGIPVYTASYKKLEGNRYATGDTLLREGVIPLLNCSVEAAYAKLMLAFHQKETEAVEKLTGNLYFERIETEKEKEST